MTETALKRVKSFERLSFLYLLIGDIDKLQKMLKIAELRTDILSRCAGCACAREPRFPVV